tara:strand:- start:66 stop:266 length:201 start_codon:yes stop_codon:yes gene_type:complete
MEPLSVISLIINLASFNTNNEKAQIEDNQYYYSIADAKHQIFNGKVENLNIKNINKFSKFNLSLKK